MLSAAAVSWKHLDRQPRGCPLIHPADDEEPHTTQPDEEKQTPSNEDGSAAKKASTSTGWGKGLTKAKPKGHKGQAPVALSLSARSGDLDATKPYRQAIHRILDGVRDGFELARERLAAFICGDDAGGLPPRRPSLRAVPSWPKAALPVSVFGQLRSFDCRWGRPLEGLVTREL